jgi:hypothetical protein
MSAEKTESGEGSTVLGITGVGKKRSRGDRRGQRKRYKEKHPEKVREWARVYNERHPGKRIESTRVWRDANKNKRQEYAAKWYLDHPGYRRDAEKVAAYKKARNEAHPEEKQAQSLVGKAIRAGKIVRGVCVVCGELKVDAHHEDYNKPLDVVWLCHKHHLQLHKGLLCLLSQRPTLTTAAPLPV